MTDERQLSAIQNSTVHAALVRALVLARTSDGFGSSTDTGGRAAALAAEPSFSLLLGTHLGESLMKKLSMDFLATGTFMFNFVCFVGRTTLARGGLPTFDAQISNRPQKWLCKVKSLFILSISRGN